MRQTLAYVRVSTEDQTDLSPEAQAKRCKELARWRDLGPVTVLSDEGVSAKNLDRPAMKRLIALIEADEVAHLVIWRWDRLTRDQGDSARLVKLFQAHGVSVHSVSDGDLNLASASGKAQVGFAGVIAQLQRDQIVENTLMGQREAAERGRWQNHAPTGYDMVKGELVPNEKAPIVQRIFSLRAQGRSFQEVADSVDMKYPTVRFISLNRAYLGEVKYSGEWYPGIHAPLVNEQQFNAAQRGHTPGRRHGRHLLSGTVRCGLCGRVASIRYNDRNQGFFRCGGQGKYCKQPARAANGLERAAVLGLGLLASDLDLQAAIRYQLSTHKRVETPHAPSTKSAIGALEKKQRKLLDLHYGDKIDAETFATEHRHIVTQIKTLQDEAAEAAQEDSRREAAVNKFDQVAELLADFDVQSIWNKATPSERWTLVKDLVDSVCIYPDRLTVQVAGAPPFTVALDEVGLKKGGRTVVSEGRREPALETAGE
jgi:site-specific DNA recombinase